MTNWTITIHGEGSYGHGLENDADEVARRTADLLRESGHRVLLVRFLAGEGKILTERSEEWEREA